MENREIRLTEQEGSSNNTSEEDIEIIKDIFMKPVLDIVKEAKESNKEVEPILRAVIPEEFLEEYKSGSLKLMKSKSGELLPNIVNGKNRVVKKVRIEEIQEKLDKDKIDKLSEYALEQKLDAIKEQLECILCIVEDVEKGQRNDRYGKIDGAIKSIKQSLLESDVNRRDRIQDIAQNNLNEAFGALNKEISDSIGFFKEWEERTFIQKNIGSFKFSTWNINRKFNKLCEDYLYLKKAKTSLIELKLSQGMEKYKVDSMIKDLNSVDIKLKERNISNWLAPRSESNEWQYRLLCETGYRKQLIIEYDTRNLLSKGEKEDEK